MIDHQKIYRTVKSAFCDLMDFKIRGDSIEITTPFCTLNNKFVSLFISEKNGKFIISDGGWINSGMYEVEYDEEAEVILGRIYFDLESQYSIKCVEDKKGLKFYYKVSSNLNTLASDVFDMGNFVLSLVNSYCHSFAVQKEVKEIIKFRRQTDSFLKANFKTSVKFREALDDMKEAKFNAIIKYKTQQLTLINYITGSNSTNFNDDILKSIVYFEMADNSIFRQSIKEMITIVNDDAPGFVPAKSQSFLALLNQKLTIPFYTWTRRDELLKAV